ncbi:MAG: tetratricopeptide repeat protein, partial [Bacteroidota bacterium]
VEDELLGEAPRPTPAGALVRLVTPMDSVAGRIRVAQLTAGWPFRPEEAKPFRLDTTRTPAYVAELAQGLMEGDPWLQSAATLADRYEADGRIRDALLTRRAVVQAFPFLPEAWSHLATLEMNRIQAAGRQDRLPYVAGLFQQALDQDSTHVPALAMLGALALQAGDRSTAIQFLERAQSEEPETKQVLYNLSGAYLMERRFQEAEQLAEQLVTLEPDNPRYQALLEGIRRDAGTS